jgi:hypothetical protein
MSVIFFNKEEIIEIVANLLAEKQIVQLMSYTQNFNIFGDKKDNELFLITTMYYVFLGNRIAYALQYESDLPSLGDTIFELRNIFEKIEEESVSPSMTTKQLLRKCTSLIYNCSTNDGNKFIDSKYSDCFEKIIDILKDIYIAIED